MAWISKSDGAVMPRLVHSCCWWTCLPCPVVWEYVAERLIITRVQAGTLQCAAIHSRRLASDGKPNSRGCGALACCTKDN